MTLPLPAASFERGRTVLVIVDGIQVEVRVLDVAPPGESRFAWLSMVDRATGQSLLPSEMRRLHSDGDFRARVHKAAYSTAVTGRQG